MIKITEATTADYRTIEALARNTWLDTYGDILSEKQIEYMLDMMYNKISIVHQIEGLRHHFLLIQDDSIGNEYVGFVSYELNYDNQAKTKIHKLYVVPHYQGKGLGKALIKEIISRANQAKNRSILLNMNRYNKSLSFYERMGFNIVGEEDIDIGNDYLMEDYIFEKTLS